MVFVRKQPFDSYMARKVFIRQPNACTSFLRAETALIKNPGHAVDNSLMHLAIDW
jgi:hypothetical protein